MSGDDSGSVAPGGGGESVRVAVRIRPLIGQEIAERCSECISVNADHAKQVKVEPRTAPSMGSLPLLSISFLVVAIISLTTPYLLSSSSCQYRWSLVKAHALHLIMSSVNELPKNKSTMNVWVRLLLLPLMDITLLS